MEYTVAGYGLIWLSLILYAWRLRRRLAEADKRLASHQEQ
jgi:hypothetical protein